MTDAPIRLLGMNSPNVKKVILMLEELELAYTLEHVAVFTGEQFTPEFVALNPLSKVPVLIDPQLGQPLAESGAILIWLAEREGRFLPTTQPRRAEVIQWLMVQMANIGPMLGQLNHFNLVPPGSQPYAQARYRAQAEQLYRLLDVRLATREWIAGGDYSIADMATQPWTHYLERHGFDRDAYPHLVRWHDAVAARPATIRALARVDDVYTTASATARKTASEDDLDRFFGRTDTVPAIDYSAVQKL